jgi:hypothetical protein
MKSLGAFHKVGSSPDNSPVSHKLTVKRPRRGGEAQWTSSKSPCLPSCFFMTFVVNGSETQVKSCPTSNTCRQMIRGVGSRELLSGVLTERVTIGRSLPPIVCFFRQGPQLNSQQTFPEVGNLATLHQATITDGVVSIFRRYCGYL